MNLIGRMTNYMNGNRTAEIALGLEEDLEFLDLKEDQIFPYRNSFKWISNNSVIVGKGSNYERIMERATSNGEPGLIFLDNMKQNGRMVDKNELM
jgi:ribonucleoside-triphosphate reductase